MIKATRERYSEDARKKAMYLIVSFRPGLDLTSTEKRGIRFNDTEDVLARLESFYTEPLFLLNPTSTVITALRDAASADYWYDEEKDYDGGWEDNFTGGDDE